MLKIEGKTFMNIQEAVQWLLDNNCIPFQCTANYSANTEIGLGTIVNPSPAKVRIGSLIFFADSKVSTVIGITENGFICSDKYNNLVDDVAYVTGVAINASGHLITTMSDGQTIDAGIIKQVNNFSINSSQHLIANYNDGTSTDLGAIFNGSITIGGNLTVTGGISGNAITGDSIIENMNGYSWTINPNISSANIQMIYVGVCKNGNKITFALFGKITNVSADDLYLGSFTVPNSVLQSLYTYQVGTVAVLAQQSLQFFKTTNVSILPADAIFEITKSAYAVIVNLRKLSALDVGTEYTFRIEQTFLLNENLAS